MTTTKDKLAAALKAIRARVMQDHVTQLHSDVYKIIDEALAAYEAEQKQEMTGYEWETICVPVKKDPNMNGLPSEVISYRGELYYKKQPVTGDRKAALDDLETLSAWHIDEFDTDADNLIKKVRAFILTAPSDQTAQGVTDDLSAAVSAGKDALLYCDEELNGNYLNTVGYTNLTFTHLQTLIRAATTPKPRNCEGLVKALEEACSWIENRLAVEKHPAPSRFVFLVNWRKALAAHRAQMGGE